MPEQTEAQLPEWANNLTSCLQEYLTAYSNHAELDKKTKAAKKHLNDVIETAARLMEDEDCDQMKLTSPETGEKRLIYLHKITKANTRSGLANTPELFEALESVGLQHLIKDSVNATSLESAIKEMFMDDTETIQLPPELDGIINVYEGFTVRSRKG